MELFAVEGLPEVRPGDDVGELIAERVDLREDDVVCVSHSIVSKAEGRQADLSEFDPGDRAMWIADRIGDLAGEARDPRFAQAVLDESAELLTEEPLMLAVTHFGHISVNAGIDRSNVPDADLLLLPEDPSASAERIHGTLGAPVIVTDTSGRPFRQGQRGVAIGLAGMPAARDWRGESEGGGKLPVCRAAQHRHRGGQRSRRLRGGSALVLPRSLMSRMTVGDRGREIERFD